MDIDANEAVYGYLAIVDPLAKDEDEELDDAKEEL